MPTGGLWAYCVPYLLARLQLLSLLYAIHCPQSYNDQAVPSIADFNARHFLQSLQSCIPTLTRVRDGNWLLLYRFVLPLRFNSEQSSLCRQTSSFLICNLSNF